MAPAFFGTDSHHMAGLLKKKKKPRFSVRTSLYCFRSVQSIQNAFRRSTPSLYVMRAIIPTMRLNRVERERTGRKWTTSSWLSASLAVFYFGYCSNAANGAHQLHSPYTPHPPALSLSLLFALVERNEALSSEEAKYTF